MPNILNLLTVGFFAYAVVKGITLLFGSLGELITEKAGNLNLGIPGIMYMGAAGAITGGYLCESVWNIKIGVLSALLALLFCVIFSALGGLIYSFLTISLRTNQNVTGLALTTFGTGFANSITKFLKLFTGKAGTSISVTKASSFYRLNLFSLFENWKPSSGVGKFLSSVLQVTLSQGFLVYIAIALAIIVHIIFKKTRVGLNLRAVGENPSAADADGINVTKYKYVAILIGSVIAGLGGLYYVMNYLKGTWQNNALAETGWLAIALVIFASWKPLRIIWGSILFGGLSIAFNYLNCTVSLQEIIKMLPYLVTIIVLLISSLGKKKENQPPASLGTSYFREDR